MKVLFDNLNKVYGGIWCSYEGKPCSNCANKIWVDSDDCSVINQVSEVPLVGAMYGGLITGFLGGARIACNLGLAANPLLALGFAASIAIGTAGLSMSGVAIYQGYSLWKVFQ